MRLYEKILGEKRHSVQTIDDYFSFLGHNYPLGMPQTWGADKSTEEPPTDFTGYAEQVFKASPVVYRAVGFRKAVFSQGRFQWRNQENGRLFGNQDLRILERPWAGGTTSNLLSRILVHADIGGNAYVHRVNPRRLSVWRPDWVTIAMGSQLEPDEPAFGEDAEVLGYMYHPGGGKKFRMYLPDEVSHIAPMPDPSAHFRGMSWMTPIIQEHLGDQAATRHKQKFFTKAATPNMVIKFDPTVTLEAAKAFKEWLDDQHQGVSDAYKTMYLGGGADPVVVGASFEQMTFKDLMAKAETRILMGAGVHPVLAGASEGLAGAALNAGNYKQVRRNFSDVDLQDLFNEASSSLEVLLRRPENAELVVDGRHIPFLQDDMADKAEIQSKQASAITTLVKDGFTPESAIAAIAADDMSLLDHTGLVSVQLQPPGSANPSTQGDPE